MMKQMRLSKKVSNIQVKRVFVASDLGKPSKSGPPRFEAVKRRVKKMDRKQLDRRISSHSEHRLAAYDALDWHLGTATVNEVAVWQGAGGLPKPWTKGSLRQTGDIVRVALAKRSKRLKKRVKRALPGIIKYSLETIQKDPYFLPIILPSGTMPHCRQGMKKYKGDIDDGCMRSIALAVSGKKVIRAYIGKNKKHGK